MSGDTQTAEGWYQSYLEAHKRALKAEAELDAFKADFALVGKRMEWEAEQHAKKCVELEDMKTERDQLREAVRDYMEECGYKPEAIDRELSK